MFSLEGKTALVTGASGGIGSAIAVALAKQGARLALSGSNGAKLRAFREQLNDEIGGDHVEITCDLSNTVQVEELIPATVDTFGKLDILVNNAGITRDNLAMRMKDEEWDQVIRINLEAAFRLMRAATRPMMKARHGRIVTITSVVGATGNPGQVNYAAAKGGLTAMSKALAQEVASRGITVNCVAPGFIRTAMTEVLPDPKNRVTVKDGKLSVAYANNNAEAHDRLVYRWLDVLKAVEKDSSLFSRSGLHPRGEVPLPVMAYQCGTCRMGTDPETSVLDINCRAHELDNLYVVDSSFMPSSASVGNALTVIANALRVGDHLLERLG